MLINLVGKSNFMSYQNDYHFLSQGDVQNIAIFTQVWIEDEGIFASLVFMSNMI